MRICFLAPANSIHSYRWIKYFADKGHDIHWITLHPMETAAIERARLYEVKGAARNGLVVLEAFYKVRRLVREIGPDVLHIHSAGIYGIIGALSGWHPMIITAWGSDVLIAGKSIIKGPFVRFALERADLITCDAYHMIEAMTEIGVSRKKMRLVFFGIDTERFRPAEKDADLRMRLGAGGAPLIISLRNFHPVYDIESLIQAVSYVLKEETEARFVVVGSGPQENMLKELARSSGVSERVVFAGRIANDELQKYLTSADIYVSTSLSDAGIAASTAEAMACGLPVVITDSGENKRWVENGKGGFIVPLKSPQALAARIIELAKNDALRTEFGKINRTMIEEKNNYYREMARMGEFYEEMASM